MPPPQQQGPIPTRVKIIMMCIMIALSAGAIRLAVFVGKKEGFDPEEFPKPFGLGVGPAYIGGRDTVGAGDTLVLEVYAVYRKYREVTRRTVREEEEYYKRWTDQGRCIGTCGEHSLCEAGMCFCDGDNDYVHLFGKCLGSSSAAIRQTSSDLKFRKPPAPPIPDECYTKVKRGDKTERIIDPNQAHMEACQQKTFPDEFDEKNQTCETSDHRRCLDLDINMYCTTKGTCGCRQDMQFRRKHMECELLIDVDCTEETGYDFVSEEDQNIIEVVTGDKQMEDGTDLDPEKAKKAFCVYLDRKAESYNSHRQGEIELLIWGLTVFGFILLIFALCILASTFCFCIAYIKDFIHYMDPRNAMAAITANQEMSGLA